MTLRDALYLVFINMMWGLTPVILKFGMADMPPFMLLALRSFVATIVIGAFTRWHPGQMGKIVAIALTAGALGFGCMVSGLARTDTMATIGIASQLNVPFAALLSVFVLGEQVTPRRWFGIGLSMAGGAVVAFDPRAIQYLDGFMFVTLASLLSALSIILMRGLTGVRPLDMQAWISHVSWPMLLVFSLSFESHPLQTIPHAGWKAWFAVLFGVFGTTMIAHTGFYRMVQRYEISRIAPFLLLTPIFTILFGMLLMGNSLNWRVVLGGAMTLAGVSIINWRDRRPAEEGATP